MRCRACDRPLRRLRSVTALRSWACGACGGIAAEIGSLRPSVPHDRAEALERALAAAPPGDRGCPGCDRVMQRAAVSGAWGSLDIDGCAACHVAWFDCGELRRLRSPEASPPTRPGPQQAPAPSRIEWLRMDAVASEDDVTAAVLGVILGIPYPEPVRAYRGRPGLTWTLCALVIAFGLAAFGKLGAAAARFGAIPETILNGEWVGLLTHFFIHLDIFHLAGNVLFLFLFGSRLEALIGWPRFLSILVVATIAGGLVHAAFAPHQTVPLIGASGGVSGVLAAHACLRPRSKVRLMRYFRMITVPASLAFVFWILLQLVGTAIQFTGASAVSALAHLGGAAAGMLVACFYRGRARLVEG
jgi:membrane associated rhomboid family serine protease